jgi:hypothetical protein
MEDTFTSTGFSTVIEEASDEEDWGVGFSSVTKEQPVRHITHHDFPQ